MQKQQQQRIVHLTISDTVSGINHLPIGYQIDEDYTCDWLFFTPSLAIDTGTAPQSVIVQNIGIRVFPGKFYNRGWITDGSYTQHMDRARLRFPYASSYEIPWRGDKLTCLIEFWGIAPTSGTLEFSAQPYTEER
jgi:hypothetical protein